MTIHANGPRRTKGAGSPKSGRADASLGPDHYAAAARFRLEVGGHVLALQSVEETFEVRTVHATDEVAVIRGEAMERASHLVARTPSVDYGHPRWVSALQGRPRKAPSKDGGGVRTEELSDRSVGDLVERLSQQTATLVRDEMRLAQAELQEKGKRAGVGAGMFGGAGLVALYGVGALTAAAILLIGTAVEPWLAAVIVGVALLAIGGLLALTGKKQVEQATPPKPERAIESVQKDVEHVKESARR
jgi:uncharacterized membrane protein YqjE